MLSTHTADSPLLATRTADVSPLERLVAALAPEVDRRNQSRVAAPYMFTLTPLEDLGRGRVGDPTGDAVTVVGKDLSSQGLGFYHDAPITHRYVRLAVDDPQFGYFEVDVQLNRCRFTKLGWYESGGRVLRVHS